MGRPPQPGTSDLFIEPSPHSVHPRSYAEAGQAWTVRTVSAADTLSRAGRRLRDMTTHWRILVEQVNL